MGYYTQIHVMMACDENDGVAKAATEYLATMEFKSRDAGWYLETLAERTGANDGPKGGVSHWGIVGNYTNLDEFIEDLKPFWEKLLRDEIDGGPHMFEHIIILYEAEQSEATTVVEIGIEEITEKFFVKNHGAMPFAFRQF